MVVDIGIVKRHIKPKADSTLRNMRKDDLIEYIRCLENNYNVAVSFNNQQEKNINTMLMNAFRAGCNWGYGVDLSVDVAEQEILGAKQYIGEISEEEAFRKKNELIEGAEDGK